MATPPLSNNSELRNLPLSLKRKREEEATAEEQPGKAARVVLASLPLAVAPPPSAMPAVAAVPATGALKNKRVEPLSFLEQCTLQITNHVIAHTNMARVLARMVAEYMIDHGNAFGAKQWEEYFRCRVGKEPSFPDEFFNFWYGPDPLDPKFQVCDTHIPPVLRPQIVAEIDSNISSPLSINRLGNIIQSPRKGPKSYYNLDSEMRSQYGQNEAGPPSWFVMRKEIAFKGLSFDQQVQSIRQLNRSTQAGYEEGSCALDIGAVVFSYHVSTGVNLFEYSTKNGVVHSHCLEKIQTSSYSYQGLVGSFSWTNGLVLYSHRGLVGSFSRTNGLVFLPNSHIDPNAIGIALLRKV